MAVLDSNILIYSSLDEFSYLRSLISKDNVVSEISRLEVLGYSNITDEEKNYFESAFAILKVVPITSLIIDSAIEIRKQKRMSVGDSIIAATAISLNMEMLTRNIDDFANIQDLKVINPINV